MCFWFFPLRQAPHAPRYRPTFLLYSSLSLFFFFWQGFSVPLLLFGGVSRYRQYGNTCMLQDVIRCQVPVNCRSVCTNQRSLRSLSYRECEFVKVNRLSFRYWRPTVSVPVARSGWQLHSPQYGTFSPHAQFQFRDPLKAASPSLGLCFLFRLFILLFCFSLPLHGIF